MQNQISQDVFGTNASPTTLTDSLVAGNAMLAKDFSRLSLDVKYTPNTNSAYAQILVEYSNDDLNHSGPTNWYQFVAVLPATTQVDVYASTGDQLGAGSGTPFNVPTSATSVAAEVITVHLSPDTELNAKWVRVRAKEVGGSSAGTLHVRLSLAAGC